MRSTALPFNPKPSTVMHIDLNSCFASIEQLADPFLRGKPVAVAAYDSPRGCIIAPSVEAKRLGISVGMQVQQGRQLCRNLIVLQPDPDKYRAVHRSLRKLLSDYTDQLSPKSIDEFVLNLEGFPALKQGMPHVAREIKTRIKKEVGESLTVSIGIAPNRYLAKVAAGLRKPDGLDVIDAANYRDVYSRLQLMDLPYIKQRNSVRLNTHRIYTVMDFFNADVKTLRSAFQAITGYWWYLRLRGWEIDDVEFGRHSYGNSFALPKPLSTPEELAPILNKLTEKTGQRMRAGGYQCGGVHVSLAYTDGGHWHKGMKIKRAVFDSREIYAAAFRLLCAAPYRKPVAILAESVFDLQKAAAQQLGLFEDIEQKQRLTDALDQINSRWGNFVITPARMLGTDSLAPDRISFGGVKELEEELNGRLSYYSI